MEAAINNGLSRKYGSERVVETAKSERGKPPSNWS
jgi:pyruvate/2-oxoglutarate/acetoin dehydrogenase E1 component